MNSLRRILIGFAVTVVTPLSAQTHAPSRLPTSGGALGFGVAIALTSDLLFVARAGAIPGFPMPPAQAGAVHMFRAGSDGAWSEVSTVTGTDTKLGDGFGSALAAESDLLVVGAPAAADGKGAAYVFRRGSGGGWTQERVLVAGDGEAGDQFGTRVGLTGDVVLVGAPGRDSARGAVYVFRRAADGWTQQATLAASSGAAGDRFGSAIALGAGIAAIGAPGPAPGGFLGGPANLKPGAAYVFRAEGGTWGEGARLTGGSDSTTAFGIAVMLDGEGVLVSAPVVAGQAGRVYRFQRGGTGWQIAGHLAPSDSIPQGLFGSTMLRLGGDLLVGAPLADNLSGAVYIYAAGDGSWRQRQRLSVAGIGLGTAFGAALAGGPDLAVVGGPMADFFEGTGFLFARDGASGEWRPRGTVVDHTAGLPAITGGETRCAEGTASAFACQEVDLVAFLPTSALGAKRGIMVNDIWGWTDAQTGREFALVGRMDGTAFVDLTDPANPRYLGELPLHQGANPNLWRDIKVYRDHAFIVADGAGPHGMQVFDLTQLRDVRMPPVTFTETAHYDGIASAHNIVINEESGFAYPVGASGGGETCGGALHMIDVRNPKSPTFAGCYADPATGSAGTGYTHDAQCVTYRGPDEAYRGRELCFNASETAVGIADVTDKAAPKPISVAAYPNVGYTHQGWLSDDHRHFYVNDELDEIAGTVPRTRTLVWDVTDLDDPVLLTEFFGTTSASDHNLYVRGRYMYQSNYVSGLRIIDVADPANPVEVGYFDTVPYGENVPGFAGTWSNYPYFKSGAIVVTSMREGLFVLRHRQMPLVP